MPPNACSHASLFVDTNDLVKDAISEMLDKQADTDGLAKVNYDNEDWTDVKHSERKKRDRVLDDGVLLGLMKKSDAKGFERLATNLSIMAMTAFAIHRLGIFSPLVSGDWKSLSAEQWAKFLPLYFFFGFCYQSFACKYFN